MDVLGNYQPRAGAKLDEIATMLGYPGKYGMSGADVWDKYQQGALDEIRQYCETDVLNTYWFICTLNLFAVDLRLTY
jgi:predicted PolB exonuclease-like 3'-5' exonuclease